MSRSGMGEGAGHALRLRTRLALAVAAVLLVTIVLSGAVLVRGTRAALVDEVDAELIGFAGRAHGARPQDSKPPSSESAQDGPVAGTQDDDPYAMPYVRLVYDADGTLLVVERSGYKDDPDPLPAVPDVASGAVADRNGTIRTVRSVDGSMRYRLLVLRDPDGTVTMAAAPLTEVDRTVAGLVRRLLLVGAIALATATLASWWLIRRGLQPVDRMVDTAAAIAAGDLGRRVPDADPGTELGRLGRALNDMLHQIEGAMRARAASEDRLRRFVADAAHELRTPLTSLRGYAELYRQGALPDDSSVAGAMGRIESEGARMARLVEDLLLLARLDQQRGVEREPIELTAVVADAIAGFRAGHPGWPVTHALGDPVTVCGDRLRLRQVIDNLLANVPAHTPPDTPVHVAVTREGDRVAVSVADEGPGIAPDDRERVFDRFWRGGSPRLRGHGGTGLGLAIVASLVGAHGGEIAVHSEPGRGATFTVRLPVATRCD
jgi:two-component system OmpR family sensor kinase